MCKCENMQMCKMCKWSPFIAEIKLAINNTLRRLFYVTA